MELESSIYFGYSWIVINMEDIDIEHFLKEMLTSIPFFLCCSPCWVLVARHSILFSACALEIIFR